MKDIPSVVKVVNTGIQILTGEIQIFHLHLVMQYDISSMCHLIDDSLEHQCNSGHCYLQDWFKG
jgi:hypothetical protein